MSFITGTTDTEYSKARENGKPAEMVVSGALRGGWYFEGNFFYSRGRTLNKAVPASSFPLDVKVFT